VGGFRAYVAASALMDNARPLKLFSSNAGVPDIDICPVVKVGDEHLILKKMNVETVSLTRKRYSAEEKIRIVLDGLRGEESIAELCRQEGIAQGLYYKWSKDFLEAGKKRLAGDITRQANSSEVKELKSEARELKECVAELTLENRLLKKSMLGDGGDEE